MNGFLAQYVVDALSRQLEEDQGTTRAHRPHGRRRRDRNRIIPR